MAISEKTIKILWSNAAGRCSFSDCGVRLTVNRAANAAPYTLGEMAHIKGKRKGSNRHDKNQTIEQRDSYENLILLCPTHHTLIDKLENELVHTTEILLEMKNAHENNISKRLEGEDLSNIEEIKDRISIYLAENHQAWIQYGPLSELAQKNPHSDEIHAVWISERLSIIVPNNRKIVSILNDYRKYFNRKEQAIISKFLSHANSYERWINDKIPYQGVMRFPIEFEQLITE
jgi:hypothetical protein